MDIYWNICFKILKLYSTPVRNKETEKHTNLEDEFDLRGGWEFSPHHIFFRTAHLLPSDRRIHVEVFLELISLFGQLKSCQCEF